MTEFDDLPGWELVEPGLRDAAAGVTSASALLVEIAAPRLRALGFVVTAPASRGDAEIRLYEYLGATGVRDPYGEYNALLRRLSSFIHALERRRARPVSHSSFDSQLRTGYEGRSFNGLADELEDEGVLGKA